MSKIIVVSMSVFYLLMSIGFSVSVHHCDGTDETIFGLLETKSCCCSLEPIENSCCSDKELVVLPDLDQQLISNFTYQWQLDAIQLEVVISVTDEYQPEGPAFQFLEYPPPKLQKAFILFHQLTFYG